MERHYIIEGLEYLTHSFKVREKGPRFPDVELLAVLRGIAAPVHGLNNALLI